MQKKTKVFGVISLFFSVFTVIIFIQYLVESSSPDSGWVDLGFFLIALVFLIIAVILSIPFLIIGFKHKFKQMLFYTLSHLSFLVLSVIIFIVSLS